MSLRQVSQPGGGGEKIVRQRKNHVSGKKKRERERQREASQREEKDQKKPSFFAVLVFSPASFAVYTPYTKKVLLLALVVSQRKLCTRVLYSKLLICFHLCELLRTVFSRFLLFFLPSSLHALLIFLTGRRVVPTEPKKKMGFATQ